MREAALWVSGAALAFFVTAGAFFVLMVSEFRGFSEFGFLGQRMLVVHALPCTGGGHLFACRFQM